MQRFSVVHLWNPAELWLRKWAVFVVFRTSPRYGNIEQSTKGPQEARGEFPELMVGIGAFMEGIDQNYVMYDAFYISFDWPAVGLVNEQEMGWRTSLDLHEWVHSYARRRYGASARLELMWDVLIDRVYLREDRWQSYPYPMTHEPRMSNALREKTIDGTVLAFRLFTDSIRESGSKTNPWRYIS